MSNHLENLPREIFLQICSFLECKDCCGLKLACKKFLNLLDEIGEKPINPETLTIHTNINHNKNHRDKIVGISSDGKKFALRYRTCDGHILKIFNIDTSEVKKIGRNLFGHIEGLYFFDNDTKIILFLIAKIEIWDIIKINKLWSSIFKCTHFDNERCISLSSNEEKIVFLCKIYGHNDPIKILNLKNYELSDVIKTRQIPPNIISLSSNGKYMAIDVLMAQGYRIQIMNLETKEKYISCTNSSSQILDIVFFLDDKKIMVAYDSKDANLKIWDLETNTCRMVLQGHTDIVNKILLSGERRVITASLDQTIKIWSTINSKRSRCLFTLNIEQKNYILPKILSQEDNNYEKIIYVYLNKDGMFDIKIWKIPICKLHW